MPELAAPTAPAPAAAPTPAPEPKADPLFNPAVEEHFKSYDKPKEQPKPAAKTAVKPEEKKTEAKTAEKPPDKQPEKAKEETKTEPKPEEKKTPEALEQFSSFKELRTKYEETKRRAEQHETKIKEFEAKLAEAAKTGTVADEKVWQEKIAAKEKELGALQAKLAETDFTQSQDYQDRYYKPYENAWKRAMIAMTGLHVTNEDGTTRPVTKEDAEFLLSLPDAKALSVAKQMFADDISALMLLTTHKGQIAEKFESLNEGKAQFQKIAEERRNKQFVEGQQMEKTIGELWARTNKEIGESSPWFKLDETDPEGSVLLEKGLEESFKAFDREWVSKAKPEEVVKLHAQLVHKAGAYDRLAHAVTKLTEERDALKKERDELMDSAPKSDPTTPRVEDDADKAPSELIDKIQWRRG